MNGLQHARLTQVFGNVLANAAKLTPGGWVDASGDNRESGLAIGLHLVKRLVGLHTATVTAFSEGVNQGRKSG